jgi:quinohemoprotein ethanol dehydrogenase
VGGAHRHRRRRRTGHLRGGRQAVRVHRRRLGRGVRPGGAPTDRAGPGTVYTFALGGAAKLPAFVEYKLNALLQGVPYDKSQIEAGTALYVSSCVFCHGVPGVDRGGNIPNLGYSPQATIANLDKFVLGGALAAKGMPDFTGRLTTADVEKIKAFIQGTADAIRPK